MKYYDERRYAFENYFNWINAPVLILQGDRDPWCEVSWQEKVVGDMVSLGKKAELVVIEGADHNMAGPATAGWGEAVRETLVWFSFW
jgi:dipeptidyl aminopeptidase/acylaminoacyl peptidase